MRDTRNVLIIVGSAPCAQEDVAGALSLLHEIQDMNDAFDVMAIGMDAVNYIVHIDYFATYHTADIDEARIRREADGLNTDYKIIAHMQYKEMVQTILPCNPPSGSSALLGVLAGIKLGYRKIIVCGCPLIGKNAKGFDYANFQKGWTAKFAAIKDKTRSMSGWTKKLLGAPDEVWLND